MRLILVRPFLVQNRDDHIWNVYAADLDETDEFSLNVEIPKSEHKWANYVRGW